MHSSRDNQGGLHGLGSMEAWLGDVGRIAIERILGQGRSSSRIGVETGTHGCDQGAAGLGRSTWYRKSRRR